MKKLLIIFLLIGITANAQRNTQNKDYAYGSIGFGAATIPNQEPKKHILDLVATAGIRYKLFDVSLNYEYVNLEPKYHSYFIAAQIIPITTNKLEFGVGLKYGRIIREDTQKHWQGGTYNYHGVFGEVRYTPFKKFNLFISLVPSLDYRGDIAYIWEKSYLDSYKFSNHLKIGFKL